MIRKTLLVLALFVTISGSAHAQLFGGTCTTADGPCSGLADQIISYIRQGLQLVQETTTAEQEVINTLALPGGLFQDATGRIIGLTNIIYQGSLLQNNPGTFISNLTAGDYPLPANAMPQIITYQNTVGAAIQNLGQVLDTEAPKLATSADTLNALEGQALGTEGRQQTLQDQAQIQAAHAQQLQSHEAVEIATAQARHATLLADHDRKAMSDKWADLLATAYTPYDLTAAKAY